jgi:tetratricopeptide (TPR) repeat protein
MPQATLSWESIPVPGETYTSVRATPELVGREKELALIENAIQDQDIEHSYIVYITGSGGVGKTRVVKHVLAQPRADVTVAPQPIDLYHAQVHSLAGFIGALLDVLKPFDEFFREERQRSSADLWQATARVEQEGFTVAEIISQRKELTRFTSRNRVVLALDTAERLQETDPAQQALGLTEERPAILDWLLKDFLPNIENVVVLLAGRPGPGSLRQALEQIEGKRFLPIELPGLNESETLAYFEAVAQAARLTGESSSLEAAKTIQGLDTEARQVIFYCLCDGETPSATIRPILLALAIDYLIVEGRLLPALTRPLAEAKGLSPDQRREIQDKLGRELIRTIRDNRRPADEVIVALAWIRKGATADLLARVGEQSLDEVQEAFDKIRDLSFVKIRPTDDRIFLHDEMYNLIQRHVLDQLPPPRRHQVFQALQKYYDEHIEQAREGIAELYRPLTGAALPEPKQVIATRARLQDALVEDLYYRLRHSPAEGFQTYFCYAEEAISARDESLDMQLRAELLGFLAERDSVGQPYEIDGLRRADVVADAAVRWVKRFIEREQYDNALRVARCLRIEASNLIEAGGDLAKAERDVREAQLLSRTGPLQEAESLLKDAIPKLEKMPPSLRQVAILARAYNNLGYLNRLLGRHYGAINTYRKALPLWRTTKIEVEQANTLNNLAFAEAEVGEGYSASRLAFDALHLWEKLGPREPVGRSLSTLAHIKIRNNELEEARVYAERSSDLASTLGSARLRGLALIALAEAERRISDWGAHLPLRTEEWLQKAIGHAKEAKRIFEEEVKSPDRQVEALLELGCAYRDLAKFQRGPKKDLETARKSASSGHVHLEKAAQIAGAHAIVNRQIDALVNLAWLYYYVLRDEDAKHVLDEAVKLIPPAYYITPRERGLGGLPILDKERATIPFTVQLGKAELLRGQITFNYFERSGNKDTDLLKAAAERYTLSSEYDRLFSEQVFRDMRRGMDRIYERLRTLSVRELQVVYDAVTKTERQYGLSKSYMRQFLEESFGPPEMLTAAQL